MKEKRRVPLPTDDLPLLPEATDDPVAAHDRKRAEAQRLAAPAAPDPARQPTFAFTTAKLDELLRDLSPQEKDRLIGAADSILQSNVPLFDDRGVAGGLLEVLMDQAVMARKCGIFALERTEAGDTVVPLATRLGLDTVGVKQFPKTLIRQVIETGRIAVGVDAQEALVHAEMPGDTPRDASIVRTVGGPFVFLPLYSPLGGGDEGASGPFACLGLLRDRADPRFTRSEQRFLEILCRIVGPSLHRSRAYRQLQAALDSESHQRRILATQVVELQQRLAKEPAFERIGGRRSEKMMRAIDQLNYAVMAGDQCVLLTGESGVGKELFARAIHEHSANPRRSRPLIAVPSPATALNRDMLEARFFGHKKGAFTGANEDRVGLFEAADGGTIFLDEITETPQEFQALLLRALQERTGLAVGATKPSRFDVQVIAATNRDPVRAVEEGRLRSDLYHRLAFLHIAIPPLRERREDIRELANALVLEDAMAEKPGRPCPDLAALAREEAAFSREAMEALVAHDWPGNVRELKNVVGRSVIRWIVRRGSGPIDREDVKHSGLPVDETPEPAAAKNRLSVRKDQILRDEVERALRETNADVEAAAARLGIKPSYLYDLLGKKFKIKIRDYRKELARRKDG